MTYRKLHNIQNCAIIQFMEMRSHKAGSINQYEVFSMDAWRMSSSNMLNGTSDIKARSAGSDSRCSDGGAAIQQYETFLGGWRRGGRRWRCPSIW